MTKHIKKGDPMNYLLIVAMLFMAGCERKQACPIEVIHPDGSRECHYSMLEEFDTQEAYCETNPSYCE